MLIFSLESDNELFPPYFRHLSAEGIQMCKDGRPQASLKEIIQAALMVRYTSVSAEVFKNQSF